MKISNLLTLKFFVELSLAISMFVMGAILIIGYTQIRKTDNNNLDNIQLTSQADKIANSSLQTVGGENGSPSIVFKITPETIAPGESATIDWKVENAESCQASGAWNGDKNLVGNQSTGALNESQTYKLICKNTNGSTEVETTVIVDNQASSNTNTTVSTGGNGSTTGGNTSSSPASVAPVVTLSISPGSINAGSSATISWTTNSNAQPTPSCSASGSWSGGKATSGNETLSPSAGSYSYTMTCSSSAGSGSKTVSLTVNSVSSCGSGGSCTAAEVASHNTAGDCWMIIKYTASGGNGGNGQVYKIASSFFGSSGSHNSLPGAPSISAGSWCGKNISSTFNGKHSGGSRSDSGGNSAIWWLTNNGNSLIGPYSGS